MQDLVPITVNGAEKLKEELHRLKKIDRPRIIAAIAEARAHGDLRENAEYHAAREEQSFAEGRISEIESKLANCRIIDVTKIPNEGKVIFGSTVSLKCIDTDETMTYQIVGVDEADLKEHKISVSSPLARAIIGKFVDDEVEVQTPKGPSAYEITGVEYI